MAGRPPKEGIDYAGWSVDMFDSDTKIDKLLDAQGACGFLVYFYLCQKAFGSKGYYYLWSFDDAATTSRKIGGGVGSETVKNTVNLCFQIGLFDKNLFDGHGILTSRGIQKRFFLVAKDRKCKTIKKEFWLLTEEESVGLDFCGSKSNYQPSKSNYAPSKLNYHTLKESKVNDSKLNKSKAKEIKAEEPIPPPPPSLFGIHKNVLLSDEEYENIIKFMGTITAKNRIDKFSNYIYGSKAKYDNHYSSILKFWIEDGSPTDLKYNAENEMDLGDLI